MERFGFSSGTNSKSLVLLDLFGGRLLLDLCVGRLRFDTGVSQRMPDPDLLVFHWLSWVCCVHPSEVLERAGRREEMVRQRGEGAALCLSLWWYDSSHGVCPWVGR